MRKTKRNAPRQSRIAPSIRSNAGCVFGPMKSAHLYKMGRHGLAKTARLGHPHALLVMHFALSVHHDSLFEQGLAPLAALGCAGPVHGQPLRSSGST